MKPFRNFSTAVLAVAVLILTAQAKVSVAPVFTDNMVLQQNTEAPIWGYADPNAQVTVHGSWDPKFLASTISDSDGYWIVSLKTPKAGGPYTVSITSGTTITLDNVMAGEVWLCSGQSNMEWTSRPDHGIMNREAEIAAADYPYIRIFRTPMVKADTPQYATEGQWKECNPETMEHSSAVAYFFARRIYQETGVPVGLIESAWGGSPIEAWIPVYGQPLDPLLEQRMAKHEWAMPFGSMYNRMIYPFTPMKIAGALWYQGESNVDNCDAYGALLKEMIGRWREKFDTQFPFYLVQIAPFSYNSGGDKPAIVREQQEIVARTYPKTGMVVVSDLVDDVNDIHPRDKQNVGLRLADMALSELYHKPVPGYKSPTFKSMKVKNGRAVIEFFDPSPEIRIKGSTAKGLLVAGADGKFVPAKAQVTGKNKLEVWSDQVSEPVTVRYSFDDNTIGNLFSAYGMPVAPFRTDRKLETKP